MKPYHVVVLLGLVLTVVTTAAVGMVYFTRQADNRAAATATIAADTASVAAANAKDTSKEEAALTTLLAQDHITTIRHDKQLTTILLAINSLLTNRHTTAALNAKAAKADALAGEKIIVKVDNLLCAIARQVGASPQVVRADCVVAP